MYVPLHCALVTDLYEQYWRKGEKQFAPKTLTQLYTCLICSLLERHLEDVPQYSGEKYKIHEISDLPPDVYEQLMKLSALAARGIENKEFVFENVNCETLGLLQKVSEDDHRSRNTITSYSFLHLTLQEYLAALYWSKCGEEVSSLFEQTGALPIKKYFKKKTDPDIHWPALHFYAGLTGIVRTPLEEIIRANQSTEYNYLYLLFECQCAELVSSVFKEGEIEITVRSHMGAYVTGHCIAQSCETTKWKIKLKKSGFVVNLVHGIEHAKVICKGGSICTLNVSSGTSDCDIIRFMHLLGQIKEYIENLHLSYTTDLKTCNDKFLNLIQQFSLEDFVYKRFYITRKNPFIKLLKVLGCFKTLKKVTLYFEGRVSQEQLELLDNFSTTICMQTEERSSNDDGSFSVCSADSDSCVFGRIVRKEDSGWSYTLHAPFEWKKHFEVIVQFFSSSVQLMNESNISIFTDQHEWLLGPNEKSFMKIWLPHMHSTTAHRVVLCKDTKMDNFRLLVSPDSIWFLIDLFKNGVKVHFLSVYCENEQIQTVVQSARDYNPGMIVRTVHLDLKLYVSYGVETFNNGSYEVADISGTVVEKHELWIAEDFVPTILQQCVLLKSSLENFMINTSRYNLTISGAESLCTVLSESTSLKGLFLKVIELNLSEATLICKGLSNNHGLETFELRSEQGDCSILLSALEKHMTIKNLQIGVFKIGEGARSLCTLLSRNQSLMKLSLVNIHLSSDEVMLISNGLGNNQTLETVCFNNVKGDPSILLKGLSHDKTLSQLIVMKIPHSVEYLLVVIDNAKVLSHVILYDCELTSTEFQDIISGAAANNLKEIAICDRTLLENSFFYETKDFFQDVMTSRNIKITLGSYFFDREYFSSLSCADRVVIMDPFQCE